MPERALYLAAYDVTEPDRLRRALHVVKDFATGGQKSAYECYLSAAERAELLGRMEEVLNVAEDRFALVRLAPGAGVRTLGVAVAPADPDFYYVG